MASFREAVAMGCDMIECDIRRTQDHELVVIHDARLKRRPVGDLTLAELRARHASPDHPVPTLAELLDELAGRVRFDLELKEAGYERQVLRAVLSRLHESQFWLTSFLPESLASLKRAHPSLTTGLLLGGGWHAALRPARVAPWRRSLAASQADMVLPHHSLLKWGVADWARRAGHGVAVWTVNGSGELIRLLRNPLIDAVITDVPDVAVRLRAVAAKPGRTPS